MSISLKDVYDVVPNFVIMELLDQFELNLTDGIHGFNHWARVIDNAVEIAGAEHGNVRVAIVFGLFHDICRVNDKEDPNHGDRGAMRLEELKTYINLSSTELETAMEACSGHTDTLHTDNIDIACCWDADRLDLFRVGVDITPDPYYLNTDYAISNINDACKRAKADHMSEWAIELLSTYLSV